MTISVKTLSGETYRVQAIPEDAISDVKRKIQEDEDKHRCQARIYTWPIIISADD